MSSEAACGGISLSESGGTSRWRCATGSGELRVSSVSSAYSCNFSSRVLQICWSCPNNASTPKIRCGVYEMMMTVMTTEKLFKHSFFSPLPWNFVIFCTLASAVRLASSVSAHLSSSSSSSGQLSHRAGG